MNNTLEFCLCTEWSAKYILICFALKKSYLHIFKAKMYLISTSLCIKASVIIDANDPFARNIQHSHWKCKYHKNGPVFHLTYGTTTVFRVNIPVRFKALKTVLTFIMAISISVHNIRAPGTLTWMNHTEMVQQWLRHLQSVKSISSTHEQ